MAEKKRLVILDTHAILHRAYHALPDFSSKKGEPTGALYGLISMLVKIINDLKPDYVAAALDLPGPTFRDAAFADYKGKRVKTEDALVAQIKKTPEVLEALGIPVYSAEGFEADDVIGTIVEETKGDKNLELIIASGDMDTLQLVSGEKVRVFTLRKGLTDTVLYDEKGVNARFGFGPTSIPDYKGLRGDPSDNIPGVKGVGEKTAGALIAEFGTIEKMYAALKKNPTQFAALGVKEGMLAKLKSQEEEAKFSKMLAEIRRDAPIEFVVPKKTWRESVNTGKTLDMLAEFDFRSLMPRVKDLLQEKLFESSEQKLPGQKSSAAPRLFVQEVSAPAQDELQKAALAVSVLDSSIAAPDLEDILRAGKNDTFDEAYKNILAEIQKRELEFVYEKIELPLMPVLRRMEERGVLVDKDFLKKLSKEYTKELEKIAGRIYKTAGGEFNISSPKQLGEVLFDKLGLVSKKKTAGGARSTKESELAKLQGTHPIIDDILAYRELSKLLGTYIDTIPTLLDKNDRLHTSYIQIGAATGRIASKDPNLQNIPIKTELGRRIRHAFVASPGMQLVSFDYSQIELRIAAILSGDQGLMEIFKEGRDVHAEVAARVFHVKSADVTYEQRRRAKVINFGLLYGMGVNALQQGLATSRKDAQEFFNQYLAAFPRLAAYLDEVKADASRMGYTQTLFGRRRYMDGIKSPIPYVRAAAERMAINAPMQGTQADIVKIAMIEIDKLLQKGGAHMLLQVHDELVFEIETKKVGEYAPKIKEIMEAALPAKETKGVPIVAEGKVGPNWGEMNPIGK